jgi:ATP-dependent DNA helicase RecG
MILPNLNIAPSVGENETPDKRVMQYVQENGSINRKQTEHILGISQTAAGIVLRKLVDQGELVREGFSRNVRYFAGKSLDELER